MVYNPKITESIQDDVRQLSVRSIHFIFGLVSSHNVLLRITQPASVLKHPHSSSTRHFLLVNLCTIVFSNSIMPAGKKGLVAEAHCIAFH